DEDERLVAAVSPDLDQADADRALELALAAAVRQGLTGLHDMGTSLADFQQLRRFADAGRLPLRISAYADGDGRALDWLCANGACTSRQAAADARGEIPDRRGARQPRRGHGRGLQRRSRQPRPGPDRAGAFRAA